MSLLAGDAPTRAPLLLETRPTSDGVLLVGERLPAPQIVNEPAIEGVRRVAATLAGVTLGSVPRDIEVGGPVLLRIRVVRYRSETESGVRVRLDLRGYPALTVESVREGFFLRFAEPAALAEEKERAIRAAPKGPPGIFSFVGTVSGNRTGNESWTTTLSGDVAAGQLVPGLFSVETRVRYAETEGKQTYARVTGVIRGFDLGWGTATAGVGDLLIQFGGARGVAAGVAETLDMRGFGFRLTGNGSVLELFGGRARGAPFLVGEGGNLTVSNQFSGDEVAGLIASVPVRAFRLGLGWTHTLTSGGPDRDNVYGEIGFRPGLYLDLGARLGYVTGTRADGSNLSGTLLGLQGRLSTAFLDVSGAYRDRSSGYVAPGGNQEFPGEKGSSAYVTVRPLPHLTLLGNYSESESFPFRSVDLGSLSSKTGGGSVDYTAGWFSAVASYGQFTQKSIGDSLNPTDAEGQSVSLTLTARIGSQSVSAGVAGERTRNRVNPALDLESGVATLGLGLAFGEFSAWINGRYADTKRVETEERLKDYGGDANLVYTHRNTSVNAGVFGGRTPAGSAAYSADRVGGTAGFSTRLPGGFIVSANASFVRILLSSGERLDNRSYAVNLNKTFAWGAGVLRGPVGVWDSGGAVLPVFAQAFIGGRVFLDQNQNGRLDAGESPVAGVVLQVDGVSATSDDAGHWSLALPPGTHTVRVIGSSIPFAYQLAGPQTFSVSVGPRRHAERDIPLVSSGRVEGRLVAKAAGEAPPVLAGVGLTLTAKGARRTTVTESDGSFSFGSVPPGVWRLRLEESDLGEMFGVEGPAEREVRVEAEQTVAVTFEIRRLTTRERLERRGRGD